MQRYAEQLKVQYGSALGDIAPEDKVVSVPGISGREPKEISFKSLAYIIQSRMEEIIDAVNFEIQSSGYADKISAGVVLTGGGAMLEHLPQLVRFKTAMDVRVGLPNEHLSGNSREEISQPMFSTSVGLIMRGFDYLETYKSNFNAGERADMLEEQEEAEKRQEAGIDTEMLDESDGKLSWAEKFKKSLSKMFETEDQDITH